MTHHRQVLETWAAESPGRRFEVGYANEWDLLDGWSMITVWDDATATARASIRVHVTAEPEQWVEAAKLAIKAVGFVGCRYDDPSVKQLVSECNAHD